MSSVRGVNFPPARLLLPGAVGGPATRLAGCQPFTASSASHGRWAGRAGLSCLRIEAVHLAHSRVVPAARGRCVVRSIVGSLPHVNTVVDPKNKSDQTPHSKSAKTCNCAVPVPLSSFVVLTEVRSTAQSASVTGPSKPKLARDTMPLACTGWKTKLMRGCVITKLNVSRATAALPPLKTHSTMPL